MVQKLREKIAAIMTSDEVQPILSPASVLSVLSWVYQALMRLRRKLYSHGFIASHQLPCYVISVGNICMGGTGKTPMTIHLARQLMDMGIKTAVVSRGYKGSKEKSGALVSSGRKVLIDAKDAGDEPCLMAHLLQGVPVMIGKDRVAAGQRVMTQFQPDVVLLDDGFQHQRLQRNLNLLLLDARKPFGNLYVLPRGPLREPMTAVVDVDAVIMTRCDGPNGLNLNGIKNLPSRCPVFCTRHQSVIRGVLPAGHAPTFANLRQLQSAGPEYLAGRHVFVFSGLAQNEAFWQTLTQWGAHLDGTRGFKDHHPYNGNDIEAIAMAGQSAGSTLLVTSDKDFVRLPDLSKFSRDLIVMGVNIDFGDDLERWQRFIAQRTASAKRSSCSV